MHRLSGLRGVGKEEEMITFVEDRVFNDFRYHINSDRLFQLGWRELMPWEGTYAIFFTNVVLVLCLICCLTTTEGLKKTFDWYQRNSNRFGNIDAALEAHPRAGLEKGFS